MSLAPLVIPDDRPKRSGVIRLPFLTKLAEPMPTPERIAEVDRKIAKERGESVVVGKLRWDETAGSWCWANPWENAS